MKKFFKIIYILLLISNAGNSQGGWKKKYNLNNSITSISKNVFECPNGNYISIGFTVDTINNIVFNKLTLLGLDNAGNLLWKKDYGNTKFVHLNNLFTPHMAITKELNAFYYTGVAQDTATNTCGVLIKFNYNGDTLWQKIIRDSLGDIIPQGITKSGDNGLLITGWFRNVNNNTYPCLLLKTDKNGSELWRKKIFKVVPNFNVGIGILQDSLSKKIIITGQQNIGNSNSWTAYSNLLICDSLGNKIVHTTLNNTGAGSFLDVIQLKDGNFLSCGGWTHNSINGDYYLNGYAVKFDITGTEIWSKKFFNPRLENLLQYCTELNNGEIVIIGQVDTYSLNTSPYQIKTVLIKLDKNGNVISQNFVGHSSSSKINERPSSIVQTSDGGFIIATQFPNMRNPTPFSIIKMDSMFCDSTTEWCRSVALEITNFNKLTGYNFEMYPNPANEILNVTLNYPSFASSASTGSASGLSLKITDISGKQIELIEIESNETQQLKTAKYEAGIYFVSILINGTAVETKKLVIVR
jgi:hypothetical protein